jgi:hypothetical protein
MDPPWTQVKRVPLLRMGRPNSMAPSSKPTLVISFGGSNKYRPTIHDARLFKHPSNGLAFKLKSLLRSKESLATEMKRTLSDTNSRLIGFIIQGDEFREIPHSAFHSLEATHMKSILSQLHSNTWYKAYTELHTKEHVLLRQIIDPLTVGNAPDREIVVLKVTQADRFSSGLKLFHRLSRNKPLPYEADNRMVLVIVREKLVDGKPVTRERSEAPLPPSPAVSPGENHQPVTAVEMRKKPTTFVEYTVRFRLGTPTPPIVTRESNEQALIQRRVQRFTSAGGDVINILMFMNEQQSHQAMSIMNNIKRWESDPRFEWCWAEISLHNARGEITFSTPTIVGDASTATLMHLIAKRMLKPNVDPWAVYPTTGPVGWSPYQGEVPCPPHPPHMEGPRIIPVRRMSRCRYRPGDSSDSDSSRSSGTRVSNARRRGNGKAGSRWDSSDSDSESSWGEDDSIMIKMQWKKGDDVVVKLLEIWTPGTDTGAAAA